MNIKITYDWLLEYLDTDVSPQELQKYLSLSGPSVESVEKVGDNYVLDIEVTSNRVDTASVFGIAQEAQAILTQFGRKAKLRINPLEALTFKNFQTKDEKNLQIQIRGKDLVNRFTAVVLSDISIQTSQKTIGKRLQMCGIKSINNVIDISNYLMFALGQPTHVFDYDRIGKGTMIVRESKKGERIVTLDKIEIELPGGDIVIEDGNGKLIDLCGIMGGLNSSVTDKTKNVVLFVQTYNPKKIRKTSMTTGQRTVAATYFEKGLDEERVEPTLMYGVGLLGEHVKAQVSSKLYDIYPKKKTPRKISIDTRRVSKLIGVEIKKENYTTILQNLGFEVGKFQGNILQMIVPTYRVDDVKEEEDVAEEIARIYGYHNLPVKLPPMAFVPQDPQIEKLFTFQYKIKHYLKSIGLHEQYNYSMISEAQIKNLKLETSHHLKLSNPISKELLYMRTSLLPSLLKNIKNNLGKSDVLKFFEIAKVYYPQPSDLPKEVYKVGIATNTDFFDLKGITEALLRQLNIKDYQQSVSKIHIFSANEVVDFVVGGEVIGSVGTLSPELQIKNGFKNPVYLASFDLLSLIENAKSVSRYNPIDPYSVIKLDLTTPLKNYEDFAERAKKTSELLKDIEIIDTYKDKKTVRLYFHSSKKNLTEEEAKTDLEKIKKLLD